MKLITLNKGFFAKVDDEDYELLSKYRWSVVHDPNTCYAIRTTRTKDKVLTTSMHRDVMTTPKGYLIDHINGDGLDNRKENLRQCSPSQNQANRPKRKGLYTYKGVRPVGKRWHAEIKVNYKKHNLGRYDLETEAARAYNEAALKFFGEFAYLNPID